MSVKITHALISGTLPLDGQLIEEALDSAAEKGFIVHDTTLCAVDTDTAYYVATLVKQEQIAEQAPLQRRSIGMRSGPSSPKEASPNVDPNATPQQSNP